MPEIEVDREQVIQTLCAHFAHDNLSSQELELRFEHAYKAGTSAELRALVAGLPALPADEAPPAPTLCRRARRQARIRRRSGTSS